MSKLAKWMALFGTIALVGLVAVAGLVIYIDPFFQYHKPLENFPYVVDDQVDMNPGLAKHLDYDAVILGSSMVVNFDTAYASNALDMRVVKLPYNGAYPKDQSNILDIIFDSKQNTVKQVFIGVDELNYSGGVDETKFPITEYLYDDNRLNDIQYVLNKDVLLDYCIRPVFDSKDRTDWNMIYPFWWQEEHYDRQLVLRYYEPQEETFDEPPAQTYIDAIEKNLDTNIMPYIEAHPETTFTVFYPPYSILYWNDVNMRHGLDTVIEKYRYMTERFLEMRNVQVYFFQNNEEIVCDLNNYADYTHYSPAVCEYMIQCFCSGEHKVTKDNLEEELEHLRQMASEYDYEKLWTE